MEKLGIESATPGLQGIALIHYTTGASLSLFLHCLHMFYKKDDRLIWVNNKGKIKFRGVANMDAKFKFANSLIYFISVDWPFYTIVQGNQDSLPIISRIS